MKKLILGLIATVLLQSCNKSPYEIKGKPITFLEDAGWCWYEDPRAIIHNEKLIVGGISGQSGDVKVAVYDLKNNVNLGTTILHAGFEVDDHNSPVFYARPDGSILAFWAMHGKENVHYYSISDTKDYLKWSEKTVYTHDFVLPEGSKWGGVTYSNLYHIKNQGVLYNFFRNGPTYNPTFFTSEDYGVTWSKNSTHFIADEVKGRHRPYARYTQIDDNRIGISFTDGHPRNYGNSLYYAEFDGTSYYNVDGTKIKDLSAGALTTGEAEKLFRGSGIHQKKPEGYGSIPDAAWTCEMESDKDGNPYIGYSLYKGPNDVRFRLANWNGTKWIDREIAYAGTGLYPLEDSYTGLMAFDPKNPNNIFISTPANPNTGEKIGTHEIYLAQINDNSQTENIAWKQITFNSKHKNIRPIIVSGDGYTVVLWLGDKQWNHFQNYESDVVGYILENK